MSPSPKFPKILADENVKKKLVQYLSSGGCDVSYQEKGLKNSRLIGFAKEEKRILLTHDHDFLNEVLYPPENYEGIIILDIHPPSLTKQKSALEKLFSMYSSEDFAGRLFVVGEEGEVELKKNKD